MSVKKETANAPSINHAVERPWTLLTFYHFRAMDNEARPLTFGFLCNRSLGNARSSCRLLYRLRFADTLPHPTAAIRTSALLIEGLDGIRGTAVDDVVISDEVSLILRRVKDQESLLPSTDGILLSISKHHAVPTLPPCTIIFFL